MLGSYRRILRPLRQALPAATRAERAPLVKHLERELEQTKRQLRDVVEQHEASTAALKAVREELRSATEQLESSREELQRTAALDSANAQLRLEVQRHEQIDRSRQELQRALLHAQEDERSRISRELHDEIGQQLAALMLALKALESAEPGAQMLKKLAELRYATEQMSREIHHIAAELRPVVLDKLGLVGALSSHLEGWLGRSGLAVDFVSAGLDTGRLPSEIETTLYRVIQEALNNVHKHAAAQRVSVSVVRRDHSVVAIVEDDGRGFDVDAETFSVEGPRLGIAGMRERVAIVGGQLTVDSSPGSGATVRVKLPLKSSSG